MRPNTTEKISHSAYIHTLYIHGVEIPSLADSAGCTQCVGSGRVSHLSHVGQFTGDSIRSLDKVGLHAYSPCTRMI